MDEYILTKKELESLVILIRSYAHCSPFPSLEFLLEECRKRAAAQTQRVERQPESAFKTNLPSKDAAFACANKKMEGS